MSHYEYGGYDTYEAQCADDPRGTRASRAAEGAMSSDRYAPRGRGCVTCDVWFTGLTMASTKYLCPRCRADLKDGEP